VLDDPTFVEAFGQVMGNRLARVPKGYPSDHPDAELLKLKDIGFSRQLSDADASSPGLPDRLAATLVVGVPLMHLLASLPG